MAVERFRYQFFIYAAIIVLGGIWLKMLPFIPEDIHESPSGELKATAMLKLTHSSNSVRSVTKQGNNHDFFMTTVSAASGASSSSLYCSIVGRSDSKLSACISRSQDVGLVHLENGSCSAVSSARDLYLGGSGGDDLHDDIDIEADSPTQQLVHVEDDVPFTVDEDESITPPHYWTDMFISLMVLFIVGSGTSFSIYIETYVGQTEVINPSYKAMLLMVFFCSGTVANIVGIFMQISICDRPLGRLTTTMLSLGALGVLLVAVSPSSATILWGGIAMFGFSNAVAVGFCFNIANRLSYPSATSTAIIMIGSSVGVSIIPYITSLLIASENNPGVLMIVGFVSMILPIFLLYCAIRTSYVKHAF